MEPNKPVEIPEESETIYTPGQGLYYEFYSGEHGAQCLLPCCISCTPNKARKEMIRR